jgi:hypothetical protein
MTGVNGVPHPVDTIGDVELLREMVKFFGPKRLTELLGWAVFGSLLAFPQSPAEFRRGLKEHGLSKTSMYRALEDLRDFGVHLEERAGWVAAEGVTKSAETAWSMGLLCRMGKLRPV